MKQHDLFGSVDDPISSAVLSPCETYRYRLGRIVADKGKRFAYFGVNPSTADAFIDDQTVKKWIGFTQRNGGVGFLVGNVFAYRATDVRELASADDPVGPLNDMHLRTIVAEGDVLVPCWGSSAKLPRSLRPKMNALMHTLLASEKPVLHFGLTASGDPCHPMMLGYDTPLVPWMTD